MTGVVDPTHPVVLRPEQVQLGRPAGRAIGPTVPRDLGRRHGRVEHQVLGLALGRGAHMLSAPAAALHADPEDESERGDGSDGARHRPRYPRLARGGRTVQLGRAGIIGCA